MHGDGANDAYMACGIYYSISSDQEQQQPLRGIGVSL
jgi:hypothetical protein